MRNIWFPDDKALLTTICWCKTKFFSCLCSLTHPSRLNQSVLIVLPPTPTLSFPFPAEPSLQQNYNLTIVWSALCFITVCRNTSKKLRTD